MVRWPSQNEIAIERRPIPTRIDLGLISVRARARRNLGAGVQICLR